MKPSPQVVQAMVNLRANRDFDIFLGGLREYEGQLTTRCVDGSGEVQLRAAGGVKALEAVRQQFDLAPKTLEKMKSNLQPVK